MKTLFLDANIFFAATFSKTGGSAMLFKLAKKGKLKLVTCLYALNEAKRNIIHKKGRDYLPRFYELASELNAIDQESFGSEELKKWEEWIIPKNAPILASATLQKVDYLISLDQKDFMNSHLKKSPLSFMILTPGEFLQSL